MQADTIVPESGNPMALDRYGYVYNNSLRYTDPSGQNPIGIIVGIIIVLLVAVDYGWTGYDIFKSVEVLMDPNASQEQIDEAGETIFIALAFEIAEPDEALPISLPLDDLARNGIKNSDDIVKLFRSVSREELEDFMETEIFRPKPGGRSMDIKWFWENLDAAKIFRDKFDDLKHIIEIDVPASIADLGRHDVLDGLGPAIGFIDETLDALNDAIISYKEILIK